MDIAIKGRDADGCTCHHLYNDFETDQYIEVVVNAKTVTIRWLDEDGNEVETYEHNMDFIDEVSIL